jgi:ABC-type sugar transport system substrate-binding protein
MKDDMAGTRKRRLRAPIRALSLSLALCALAFVVAACGSSKNSSSSTSSSSGSSGAATSGGAGDSGAQANATPKQISDEMDAAFGGGTKITDLPKVAQDAYKIYAPPPTAAEKATIDRCLKTSGKCDLGKSGSAATLNFAESEDIDNAYTKEMRAVYLLQAIREPSIKSVTFTQASFKLPQALSNFRAHISQGADIIVLNLDLGAAMLPVIRQAAAKGVTVWANTQSLPSSKFDGSDIAGQTVVDLCKYGRDMAQIALKSGKTIAAFTGPAGNAFGAAWTPCAKKTAEAGGAKFTLGNTNWTPQGEQQAAAALAAKGLPDALIYDYAPEAFIRKFVQLKKTPPTQVGGSQTMGSWAAWNDATKAGFPFKSYIAASEVSFSAVTLHAAILAHEKKAVQRDIVLPQPIVPVQDVKKYYNASFPAGANFGSALPNDVLQAAFAAGS